MRLRERALSDLEAFATADSALRSARALTVSLLCTASDPFDRTSSPFHITVSAICFSADMRRLLLIWHSKLSRWLQPGGHVEPSRDLTLEGAARRELIEETSIDEQSISLATGKIFDIDIHDLSQGECARHFDVRFAYVANARVGPLVEGVRWSTEQEACALGYPEAAARRLFAGARVLSAAQNSEDTNSDELRRHET